MLDEQELKVEWICPKCKEDRTVFFYDTVETKNIVLECEPCKKTFKYNELRAYGYCKRA